MATVLEKEHGNGESNEAPNGAQDEIERRQGTHEDAA
jgi:hypothetical protein